VRGRAALTLGAAALVALPAAAATPPRAGLVVPGRSLGGIELGATEGQVRAAWGSEFGVCRNCRQATWYFNYRPYGRQGAGVSFRRGRAVALFTLWGPRGWHTNRGLQIGDPAVRVSGLYGSPLRRSCGTYSAYVLPRGRTTTAFYVVDERVWGFGLSRRGRSVCR
jgi:hypothetical protein